MWQKAVDAFVKNGKLVVVGVVQEQHPDRAKLYRQWRRFDWPIFVDSANMLDIAVVPIVIAIDESGIVRHTCIRPSNLAGDFLDVEYPRVAVPDAYNKTPAPDPASLEIAAASSGKSAAWRVVGDAHLLHTGEQNAKSASDVASAIAAYEKAVTVDPHDGRAHFRLGVALRRRHDSPHRQPTDAQRAVEQWGLALSANPNQYIWRRRIQQYGPRLDKPYNFYFWVAQARKDITARGETPIPLPTEPAGSELAPPDRGHRGVRGTSDAGSAVASMADSCATTAARIQPDTAHMVIVNPVVTPARVQPGQRVRVRVLFDLDPRMRPYWNNEADGITVCVDLPTGVTLGEGALSLANPPMSSNGSNPATPSGRADPAHPSGPETQEPRAVEFELHIADTLTPQAGMLGRKRDTATPQSDAATSGQAAQGTLSVPARALYYVCENKGGKCHYLRQEFTIAIHVDPNAPLIR